MDIRAFPLDLLAGEYHPKITERLQIPQQHQVVTQHQQRLRQTMVHPLRPVPSVEDILHKHLAPLEELDRSEVVRRPRITERLPYRQAVMGLLAQVPSAVGLLHPVFTMHLHQISLLPAFHLVRSPRVTEPLQGKLPRMVLLRGLHQLTGHRVLHLDLSEFSLKLMGLHLLEFLLHNHMGHQDQQASPAQIHFLKEMHRQVVTVYQQP
jgi:hypothetical protein